VREAVHGRTKTEVLKKVDHIKGRENVERVVQDLSINSAKFAPP
jgi:hypothetical protein